MSRTNASEPMLLNLGSGQRPFPRPWVNVDTQERWEPDLVADLSKQEDWEHMDLAMNRGVLGYADVICLHHTLEHFGLGEGQELVGRCFERLKPGGRLWVFVPDLRALAQAYTQGKLDHYQFAVNLYGAFMGEEWDRHKWGYDTMHLAQLLMSRGFKMVMGWNNAQQKWGADIAQDWWILGMEGVKK